MKIQLCINQTCAFYLHVPPYPPYIAYLFVKLRKPQVHRSINYKELKLHQPETTTLHIHNQNKTNMKFFLTLCLLLTYTFAHSQTNTDSTAIVRLLEKAAISFRSGDAKVYADCWYIQPYSVILISSADGKALSIPAEALAKPSASMGQGGFATATNYRMSIHGDNGWTSFDEISTAKDGTKTYSYELWMVEKINSEWKFVAASMHFYKQP